MFSKKPAIRLHNKHTILLAVKTNQGTMRVCLPFYFPPVYILINLLNTLCLCMQVCFCM